MKIKAFFLLVLVTGAAVNFSAAKALADYTQYQKLLDRTLSDALYLWQAPMTIDELLNEAKKVQPELEPLPNRAPIVSSSPDLLVRLVTLGANLDIKDNNVELWALPLVAKTVEVLKQHPDNERLQLQGVRVATALSTIYETAGIERLPGTTFLRAQLQSQFSSVVKLAAESLIHFELIGKDQAVTCTGCQAKNPETKDPSELYLELYEKQKDPKLADLFFQLTSLRRRSYISIKPWSSLDAVGFNLRYCRAQIVHF